MEYIQKSFKDYRRTLLQGKNFINVTFKKIIFSKTIENCNILRKYFQGRKMFKEKI